MTSKELLIHIRMQLATRREEHREYIRAHINVDSMSVEHMTKAAERTVRADECNALIGMINIMLGGVA